MFFQLQAIHRRHSNYSDLTNTTGWVTAMDSNLSWNYQRGFMVGVVAGLAQQYYTLFLNNFRSLLNHYEPPTNLSQWWIFLRQTRKLQNFKLGFKNRMQYGFAVGSLDIAWKVALFRQFNNGWQTNFGGFDYAYHRKIPTTLLAGILSAPLSVAIEMAKDAYYADKTFPKQLQKGYTSYFNALRRIPFEQGPFYLFKNTWPLFGKHIFGFFTMFYTYDWMKDKLSILWRASDVPQTPVMLFNLLFTVTLTSIFVYPVSNISKQMVDLWPKPEGGVCNYNNSYKNAFKSLWYGQTWNAAWPGMFKNFMVHHCPQWMLTLYLADKFGIFNYWRVDIMSGPGDNTNDDSFI